MELSSSALAGMMLHDQRRAWLTGEIGPNPLDENTQLEIVNTKKLQVDEGPHEPCRKAAELHLAAFEHGEILADYGQISFIEITKRGSRRFACNAPVNGVGGVLPLLYRHL